MHLLQVRKVPLVQIMVQGGPGTLSTVLAAAKVAVPIIVLTDSGGAASALATYCERQMVTDPKFRQHESVLREIHLHNAMVRSLP